MLRRARALVLAEFIKRPQADSNRRYCDQYSTSKSLFNSFLSSNPWKQAMDGESSGPLLLPPGVCPSPKDQSPSSIHPIWIFQQVLLFHPKIFGKIRYQVFDRQYANYFFFFSNGQMANFVFMHKYVSFFDR